MSPARRQKLPGQRTRLLPIYTLLAASFLLLPGCSDTRRHSIEGTVTLDGLPLAQGYIRLLPQEGTAGPTAGATIEQGHFSIDASKGTFAGSFRVEIVATRPSKRTAVDPETGQKVPIRQQYLPARYNTDSQLTADIAGNRSNQLEFALVSK
jgi:hypothetical protein